MQQNRKKVINDPVWGFINIPTDFIYEIIQHPYFQRLRRIRQLGLTDFVYPGALHTRFHHALGAMHLMTEALKSLKGKGHSISDEEFEAAQLAILLHDIGHGPLSHALEYTLLNNVNHEKVTSHILELLNKQFNGRLSLAISIFNGTYHRPFFHQLVSSQLDMDRMDYLSRDCYFTGVSEGTIGADRLIKMLEIHDEKLVVEEKGIYSIENFLTARRLMYWQVYLHKTTLSAENMIISTIKRAKYLAQKNLLKFTPPTLSYFLTHDITFDELKDNHKIFNTFLELDDFDVWSAIKYWRQEDDFVIRTLCQMLLHRHLFKVAISYEGNTEEKLDDLRGNISKNLPLEDPNDISYFVIQGVISNAAYLSENSQIMIKMKNESILDVAEASELPNIRALSKIVKKHYVCWPKIVSL